MVETSSPDSAVIVVLAGGQGTRFWPVSRVERPKQFLSISDSGESLIQLTIRRVRPLVKPGRVWTISNATLKPLILEHVPDAHVVCEPSARNTAACIGLAAVHAQVQFPGEDPPLVILPADHAVKDEERLRKDLAAAISAAASQDVLVTLGIPPTRPHTGYGYIKRGKLLGEGLHAVERFFEKPSLERAEKYIESGDYFWNSGMFVWRPSVVLDAFRQFLPAMFEGLMEIRGILQTIGSGPEPARIAEIFNQFESTSIDFGILEHARNCVVVTAEEFGWNDVGSWDQWAENFETDADGNMIKGDVVVIDSTGCVVKSQRGVIAVVGLKDAVVIDAGDALLVASRDAVQEVRKVVSELKSRGRTDVI